MCLEIWKTTRGDMKKLHSRIWREGTQGREVYIPNNTTININYRDLLLTMSSKLQRKSVSEHIYKSLYIKHSINILITLYYTFFFSF